MKVGSIFDCSFPWWLLLRWSCNNEEVKRLLTISLLCGQNLWKLFRKKQWEGLYNMHLKGLKKKKKAIAKLERDKIHCPIKSIVH